MSGGGKPKPVYDRFEISGCRRIGDGDGSHVEPCVDREAQFWTLYGHIDGQGAQAIGDFSSRESAEGVYYRITGASVTQSYEADGRLSQTHAMPALLAALEWALPLVANQAEFAYASGDQNSGEEIDRRIEQAVDVFTRAAGRPPNVPEASPSLAPTDDPPLTPAEMKALFSEWRADYRARHELPALPSPSEIAGDNRALATRQELRNDREYDRGR
jgi:hypothetical protein